MYGFSFTVNGKTLASIGDICYKNIICSNHMINKFEQDKVFAETDAFILLLDGVVINRFELITQNKDGQPCNWVDFLLSLYRAHGETFFRVLRGSFSGALYDKAKDKWVVFCDQLGTKFTYYSKVGNFFCCAEEMGQMYKLLKSNEIPYSLSRQNSFLLLTYGYMIDDRTLCEDIHKIPPGCYLVYENNSVCEKRYYILDNTEDLSIDEPQAIELIDAKFRKAIINEFEKDKEYGINKHLVALSGGLDCRMTSFVAHECGYEHQLNMTFSQTGYYDQTIPMQMASDLNHEWIFKALDNGLWLYDVDEVTRTTGGNVLYYGTAHSNSLLKYLNFSELGIAHSGQLGDVIVGSFVTENDKMKPFRHGYKAYSTKYANKLGDIPLKLNLNKELGMIYYRGLNGTNNGLQNTYNYTETLSPFLDIDFIETVLKIPIRLRQNHYIYKKWISAKHKKAADYIWETTGQKISTPTLRIGNRELPLANIPKSVWQHMRLAFGIKENADSINGMNPVAYYLSHNIQLQECIYDYFNYVDNIIDNELKDILKDISRSGTAMEKIQAISLLSAVKLFYC